MVTNIFPTGKAGVREAFSKNMDINTPSDGHLQPSILRYINTQKITQHDSYPHSYRQR